MRTVACQHSGSYSSMGLQATVDVGLMYATRLSLNVDTDSLLAFKENGRDRCKC